MDPNRTAFDDAAARPTITQALHGCALALLAVPSETEPGSRRGPETDDRVLDAAAELTYADLRHHARPVFLLSEICRLLIKRGDYADFRRCLAMSHKIYVFKTRRNESWYISYLYKGIAQIGMRLTDTGVANVLFALSDHSDMDIWPVDEALGHWAIMSAAIANRNLEMALKFARRWRAKAEGAGLKNETFRSDLAIQVLNLLYGDRDACRQGRDRLTTEVPQAWEAVAALLRSWTDALLENVCFSPGDEVPVHDPFPLFAGIEWHRPEPLSAGTNAGDFAFLCRLRRDYCNEQTIKTLPAQEMEFYAGHLAQWELPGPLKNFESRMREADASVFHQFAMTRVMGKYRTLSVIRREFRPADATLRDDAVLLTMDIRKFSAMCERYPPQKIFEIINPLFRIMNEELEKAGGAILEYEGDCIIAAFNTFPGQKSAVADILHRAVRCLRQVRVHSALSLKSGLPALDIGIGIAQGQVAVGYVGGLSRCHLTLIGNAINLAARIESETKDSPTPILVSRACFGDGEPDIWSDPDRVSFFLRDLSERPIKNMRPVHLYGVAPLLTYRVDFVPMGFVARAERGVVYIDTGNAADFGIIDHHYAGCAAGCACELLLANPHFVVGHLQNLDAAEIEFRLHAFPDIDCAATLYAAFDLMTPEKFHRRPALSKIAEYVGQIDQGMIPDPDHLDRSLYGVFMAHQARMHRRHDAQVKAGLEKPEKIHLTLLRAGLRVIDAAVYLLVRIPSADPASVFIHRPAWFSEEQAAVRADRDLYEADRSHPDTAPFTARVNLEETGDIRRAAGLWIANPKSAFFKQWVRNDRRAPGGRGYALMAVDWSEPGKNRFVISVDPESGMNLKGLGEALEARESEKRQTLGKPRPVHPIRPPADNSDPWYFGQGHHYTIVDSPREGTILTADEVKAVLAGW